MPIWENPAGMLSARTHLRRDGIELSDVACTHPRGTGSEAERAQIFAVVFVRRGCFVRGSEGVAVTMDPTLAYCMNVGDEQRYDHPHDHGDDCTSIALAPDLLATLWGGEPALPRNRLRVSPEMYLEHRLLLSAARRGSDPDELVEQTIALLARILAQADPARLQSGGPRTRAARAALVDGVRERLAANVDRSLTELACELAVSPHHLSRVFRAATGHTVSRHRMRLRARAALERLAAGEENLARLAADLGLADHSHLDRVIAAETGSTPSALRSALAARS